MTRINEHNYEQWAMDYIEGTLSEEQYQAFHAFLADHPAIAAQISSLQNDLPVLRPETVFYPYKRDLLRGRTISFARRQERLQRFGAMVSGAAAAAVLFGGLLFSHPNKESNESEGIVAKAVEAYPEGAEAFVARLEQQEATEEEIANTRNSTSMIISATNVTDTPTIHPAQHYKNRDNLLVTTDQNTVSGERQTEKDLSAIELSVGSNTFENQLSAEGVSNLPSNKPDQAEPIPTTTSAASLPTPISEPQSLMAHHAETTAPTGDQDDPQEDDDTRSVFGSLLSVLNDLSPVSYYNTSEESGVTIASFIHIGKRKGDL